MAEPPPRASLFRRVPPLVRAARRLRRRLVGQRLAVFHADAYRAPVPGLEAASGHDLRRAEMVLTYLLDLGMVERADVISPRRARLEELALVHPAEQLERLAEPATLARIFALDPAEVPVDELLHTLRLAVGGTIEAARLALRERRPAFNLLGGFHHAGPLQSGGFSALNDVAVAIAVLRRDGWRGRVAVLDLDAHPPDGTAAALAGDALATIGSLSGSAWQALEGVDETVLPEGAGGAAYLAALDALLARLPAAELIFVLAGGDVLAGDRLGRLGLTLADAAARDARVAAWIGRRPAVWLPAGGYHRDAWRVFATAASIVALGRPEPPRDDYDPVRARFSAIARQLGGAEASEEPWLDASDLDAMFGMRAGPSRLLGRYSAENIELALYRYGILAWIRRLGYRDLRVHLDQAATGERFLLDGVALGARHLLVEAVLERARHGDDALLYVHWLTLRHPLGRFGPGRGPLPGQDVPGLGLAKEAGELLAQMALRLGLAGVAFRPAAAHVAYTARYEFRFVDEARQADFEALLRDLARAGLGALTRAVAEGRVRRAGQRYAWQPDLMVCWLDPRRRPDAERVARLAATVRFALAPAAGEPEAPSDPAAPAAGEGAR